MPTLPLYQVDAFTDRPFAGNPAAVCPLEAPIPEALMQDIAAENNLSETAFFHPQGDAFSLRWFTPDHRGRPVRPRDAGVGVRADDRARAGAHAR